eukprot:gb/GECG01012236.1/.p1 GENE.gb/GECG01012236.1/~~gb/GECG01012236.1/.p1  ORF type:complete len:139 (+),score=14.83 gb/GECG01012236.1/:1-417(+)
MVCRTLDTADRTGASILKQKTICMVIDNFSDLYHNETFRHLQQANPGLMHQILLKLQERNHSILTKLVFSEATNREQPEESNEKTNLPLKELAGVVILLPLYFLVAANTTSFGYIVPAMNVVAVFSLLWYLMAVLRGE